MKSSTKQIAILITVHNRKEKTLSCLKHLKNQKIVPDTYNIDTFLTNDGCTDGTPEAVLERFPDTTIIEGDGNLYWNRGMYRAWEAASSFKDYDFYVWLNDDTMLFENALQILLDSYESSPVEAVICGSTMSENTGNVSYGGSKTNKSELIVPDNTLQECEIINGNFVLIPKKIFHATGNLDWKYHHAIGDRDYGLRAIKNGFKCFVAPQYIGYCELHPSLPKWCLSSTPLLKRLKVLYSPLGYGEPISFFRFEKRHYGLGVATKHFLSSNLRALIPQLWK